MFNNLDRNRMTSLHCVQTEKLLKNERNRQQKQCGYKRGENENCSCKRETNEAMNICSVSTIEYQIFCVNLLHSKSLMYQGSSRIRQFADKFTFRFRIILSASCPDTIRGSLYPHTHGGFRLIWAFLTRKCMRLNDRNDT